MAHKLAVWMAVSPPFESLSKLAQTRKHAIDMLAKSNLCVGAFEKANLPRTATSAGTRTQGIWGIYDAIECEAHEIERRVWRVLNQAFDFVVWMGEYHHRVSGLWQTISEPPETKPPR